ncbi:hypothetical protein TELCIR_01613 [Teladorsagia circumcincta]|uniref:Tc1-like transposase DDE domain-containing protein n=1 Tax=Teladorsagia circumcincta TaxID=45464 RepID=A0A2G9V1R4_TELCI|nr:hypothetical protein TELCIR_01613 [Teladorsagia circumcincta]
MVALPRDSDDSLEEEERGHRSQLVDNEELKLVVESDPFTTTREVAQSGFFNYILTSDEKWIFFDNAVGKRQWLSPSAVCMGEQLGTGAQTGADVLDVGQTVIAEVYAQQLTRVDQALRRQGVNPANVRLLHGNARSHVANITQQKIEELGWQVLPYAPYSPDLAPSDYHLFRSMQHFLAGKKFKNRDDVRIWVSKFFESKPKEFFDGGIHALRRKWRRVIDTDGEYILD